MTAPRAREQTCPPAPPDRLPPRRGGGSSPYAYSSLLSRLARAAVRLMLALAGVTPGIVYEASAQTDPRNLTTPVLTAQAVAPVRVTLRWDRTMPSPKDLDHTDFPGYRIEWSADGNDPWTSLVNVTNQYGTFEHWCVCYGTRFYDNTVPPGTTRHYRVQAVDGDEASAYSDVVSATTPALVDSDQGPDAFEYGAMVSEFNALTDQKVFQYNLDANESYRFTLASSKLFGPSHGSKPERLINDSPTPATQRRRFAFRPVTRKFVERSSA